MNDSEIRIINLLSTDTEKLLRFYSSLSEAVTGFFRPFPNITKEVLAKHLKETIAGKHISLGIVNKDELLGHGFVMQACEQFPVFGIGLKEHLHGKGHGRRLMNAVIERAMDRGVQQLTLTVLKNNIKAFTMYQSFGFKIKSEHTFEKKNDSYLMVRKTKDIII